MTTILLSFEPDEVDDAHLARIDELAPDLDVLITKDPHEMEAVVEDIEIVVGWIPVELLLTFPNLRWYQQWAAGADWLMKYPEAVERDFVLTNASGVHAVCISEQIFGYLLSFARNLPMARGFQHEGEWGQLKREMLFELADQTLLLIGLGAIGSRTARVAAAFDMRVIGVRRNPLVEVPGVDRIVGRDQLHAVLPEADFVAVALPHTAETTHFIAKAEFDKMKTGVYFVNIGRGRTVNEADLIAALQSGKIAGAGLDVFETEPLAADSPLWSMENVILTAHYAGATPRYEERAMPIFLDNLRRYQAGEALRNVIDKRLGY